MSIILRLKWAVIRIQINILWWLLILIYVILLGISKYFDRDLVFYFTVCIISYTMICMKIATDDFRHPLSIS